MSINKNDCLDCANSISCIDGWLCSKQHIIPIDKNGKINVLDEDCPDFNYQQ